MLTIDDEYAVVGDVLKVSENIRLASLIEEKAGSHQVVVIPPGPTCGNWEIRVRGLSISGSGRSFRAAAVGVLRELAKSAPFGRTNNSQIDDQGGE